MEITYVNQKKMYLGQKISDRLIVEGDFIAVVPEIFEFITHLESLDICD